MGGRRTRYWFAGRVVGGRWPRSGVGRTAMLRWPAGSTERTAKTTLSLETASLRVRAAPALAESVQVGWSVSRQTTSYVVLVGAPTGACQVSSVLLSRAVVRMWTFCGWPGAEARVARVAAFRRATLAT